MCERYHLAVVKMKASSEASVTMSAMTAHVRIAAGVSPPSVAKAKATAMPKDAPSSHTIQKLLCDVPR